MYSRPRASLTFMQLSVPKLSEADTGSFPLVPEEVASWLAGLDTLNTSADARELLRGLTHSNRLVNDLDRRRAALSLFVPPLRALHEQLMASTSAQPLPLTKDFARDATLADALLREESLAFRLLLAASDTPREVDARRAMHALLRRAELAVHTYQKIPDEVWHEAHALYRFANEHQLEHESGHNLSHDSAQAQIDEPASKPAEEARLEDAQAPSDDKASPSDLGSHYRLLLLLGIIDPGQLRARQLPLLIEWLRDRAALVTVSPATPENIHLAPRGGVWLIDVERGAAPTLAGSLLVTELLQVAAIELRDLQLETEARIREMRMTRASLLGADVLERQTLARLALRLGPGRINQRLHARNRSARRVECIFSHKYITSRLLHENVSHENVADSGSTDNVANTIPMVGRTAERGRGGNKMTQAGGTAHGWTVVDESPSGCRIEHPSAAPGSVQVGELVSVSDTAARRSMGQNMSMGMSNTRRDLLLGVVRHVRTRADGSLSVGIGMLANSVMPVVISRTDEPGAAPENGLIIACRAGDATLRTILVPPFLYQPGDRLVAAQQGRSSQVELSRCLQLNGLFSQYELKTVASRAA